MDEGLETALDIYAELLVMWVRYKRPCSKSNCPICSKGDDKHNDEGDDEDNNEGDDEDDNDGGDNDQSGQKRRRMVPSKPPPKSNQTRSHTRKLHSHQTHQSSTHKLRSYQTHQFSTPKLRSANRSIRATTRHIPRKRNRSSQQKTSTPYDRSIPYSHREGYTFAECTANDLMKMWQTYRS